MKRFAVLLIVLLGGSLGANYLMWEHLQTLTTQQGADSVKLAELEQQVNLMNAELLRINEKLASVDEQSLEGMARRANDALLDGWEALMQTLDRELQKAREGLEEASPGDPAGP
ncbi:hypothetical protein [Pseudomaricurvus sp. HS19]|uniref:hypothetical protein n=1 Tax=Pseudomaricurvus sp. HS19 TaxID=2692626 RepID=UPI00136B4F8C|nr:hypothetical protein [Pseudomaricurvus sp. HS19]MYM62515.1 hypothetical protein [Pseudomaricurvus sp. HS19]